MYNPIRALAVACALCLAMSGPACGAEEVLQAEGTPLVAGAPEATQAPEAGDSADADGNAQSEADAEAKAAQQKERIRSAQRMLIDLGYLSGAADGLYGPMTQSALTRYQTDRGLEATGELDDATMNDLTQQAAQVGDTRSVQQRLIDLGYLRGLADGNFGPRSQAALKLFQSLHDLEATGAPDEQTRSRLFSEDARTLPARLTVGSKGDAVLELQQKLIQFGFLTGEADGSYGAKTTAAVKRFQNHLLAQGIDENLGVEATGDATAITRMLLTDPEYSSYLADVAPGEESDEVKRVERRLTGLGYMDAEVDGVFDDYAVRAAEAFQTAAGLREGVFDRTFIDALFSEDAPVAEHFVLHDIAYGDDGGAVREVQEALVQGGMTISMPDGRYGDGLAKGIDQLHEYLASLGSPKAFYFEDPRKLSVEAQQQLLDGLLSDLSGLYTASDELMTKRVQRRLHTLYYLSRGNIDGAYGERTQKALREFQEENGLKVSGFADTATLDRLFSNEAVCKRYRYRLEVSIDAQRVYVYELNDAGEYDLIQTFICSTGLGNSTPRGIYLDGGPANVWHHFTKFECWARYSFTIEGDIMFHSVIYSDRDTSTLRESSLYGLGNKASHGCVRLKVSSAKWIFEHCAPGTFVIIIY